MKPEDFAQFKSMIIEELNKAESKYPVFCNDLCAIGNDKQLIKFALATARARSDAEKAGGYSFEHTINEEILEVLEAWSDGNYDACLHELAQCGAVILRAMNFVKQQSRR